MAKRFRVAFTFAGEQRAFVQEMAQILAERFGEDAILYDKFHEAEFARTDLAFHLPKLYAEQADLVVGVFGQDYSEKEWCGLEWRAIYGMLKQKKDQNVMLMRFDHMEPEGLHGLAGYIDLDEKSPAEAATLILKRLARNEDKSKAFDTAQTKLSSPSPQRAIPTERASSLLVRSFPPAAPDPANLALPPIDLSDLFHGRAPIHDNVWSAAIPQRLADALPAIRKLPKPLGLTLYTHLSIAWYLGALLIPKAGYRVERLHLSSDPDQFWQLAHQQESRRQQPADDEDWSLERVSTGAGADLALVISVSKTVLPDVLHALPSLDLPLAAVHHASVPRPSNNAITDGRHARNLADDLILSIHQLRANLRPQRLHLFAACPVGLMFLLGQQAEALGPTTVYEFDPDTRNYTPGMATG